jgi:sucrose-6-phosphate hydrolase SacC (GH32 family)
VWECPILLQLQPLPYPARGMSTPKGDASRMLDGLHPPTSLANGAHLDGSDLPFVSSWDDADGGGQQNGGGGGAHKGIQATYAVDESRCWFFCISPDAPTNPVLYWLGSYSGTEFDIANAKGPLQLDLGDVLYAPNILEDDTVSPPSPTCCAVLCCAVRRCAGSRCDSLRRDVLWHAGMPMGRLALAWCLPAVCACRLCCC